MREGMVGVARAHYEDMLQADRSQRVSGLLAYARNVKAIVR